MEEIKYLPCGQAVNVDWKITIVNGFIVTNVHLDELDGLYHTDSHPYYVEKILDNAPTVPA